MSEGLSFEFLSLGIGSLAEESFDRGVSVSLDEVLDEVDVADFIMENDYGIEVPG